VGPFKYNIQNSSEGLQVVLQGSVIETSKFPDLSEVTNEIVIVNFTGVDYINSRGIAIWIRWTESLQRTHPGIKFVLRGCRRNIVDQINAIQGFAPPGTVVESIFAPYFCDTCDKLVDVALHRGSHYEYSSGRGNQLQITPPFVKCPSCNKPMHMDVLAANFFSFLTLK